MLRKSLFALPWLICVLALSPSRAVADLSLQIGPQADPDVPDVQFSPASAPAGRQFFDVVFEETGVPEDEGLFAYFLTVRLVRPAGDAGGIRLSGAEQPPDGYVFENVGLNEFGVVESDADHIYLAANGDPFVFPDITDGSKIARVFYTIDPAGLVPGDYRIEFEPLNTGFGRGRPGEPLAIATSLADRGVIRIIPEPAAPLAVAATACLALRRRRPRV